MIRLPRRWVRYAPELDELADGTILTFPGSQVTAKRDKGGWLIYGLRGACGPQRQWDDRSVARNLPARIVRRGKAVTS